MRLIDVEKLKEAIQKNICQMSCDEPRGCSYCKASDVWDVICEQPTVDAEPVRHGNWKVVKSSVHPYGNDVACSVCGFKMGSSFGYRFCPNCGARMDKGADYEEEEDNERDD